MKELEGRTAIVTGGAMGISKACAACLVREGASVVIVDRDGEAATRAAAEIGNAGKIVPIPADIARFDDNQRAVAMAVERFGGLDILINNAGIQTYGDALTTTEEIWDRTMDVNLKGQWLMAKAAIPAMLQRGKGSIETSPVSRA